MIKINIDEIMKKLKQTKDWKNYENDLNKHLSDFNEKIFTIEELTWKEWIINLKLNKIEEKEILNDNFWKWTKKSDNFIEFEKLKEKFLDIFFQEIKFCPYCWKIPLIRYENDKNQKKWTYHLDHIFPKSKYRHLTYNFYNLIPVCSICNQFKKEKDLSSNKYNKIFHPYYWLIKNENSKVIFDENYTLWDDFLSNDFDENSKFYKLSQIYKNAQDTHNDTEFILDKILKIKTDELNFNHKKIWSSFDKEERVEHYFKNFYTKEEKDILKYSNWKLKRKLINSITPKKD